MTEFNDPLNDPRFPDRPQTPDFWRMADAAMYHDATSAEPDGLDRVIGRLVDAKSLVYMAKNRLSNAGLIDPSLPLEFRLRLLAIYVDAFCLGAEFQKSGGHRDG